MFKKTARVCLGIILFLVGYNSAYARGRYFNYAQLGGQRVTTSSFISLTTVQRSFPGALAKVCVASSGCSSTAGTLATLYSDSAGTPLGNPLTVANDGSFSFWTDTSIFDIVFYGPGITTSCGGAGRLPCISAFTWSAQTFNTGTPVTTLNCDGITDSTAAFQAALDIVGPHTVSLGASTCKITDTLVINQDRVNIVGAGQQVSKILFVPGSGGKPALLLSKSPTVAVIFQIELSGFSIYSTDTTLQKIGIKIVDGSRFNIHDIQVGPLGNWTGNNSIGIQFFGRELVTVGPRVEVDADTGFQFNHNPNAAQGEDTDHFHFFDINVGTTSTNKTCIEFTDGTYLSNFVIDGSNNLSGCKDGVKWTDTTTVGISHDVTISGVRHESVLSTGGNSINLSTGLTLRGLRIRDSWLGPQSAGGITTGGISLHNVSNASIENVNCVAGTGVACLTADSTVQSLHLMNNFFLGNSTVSLTGLTQIMSIAKPNDSAEPVWREEWYEPSSNANLVACVGWRVFGEVRCANTIASITTGNGSVLPLISSGANRGTVRVLCNGSTKHANMSGSFTTALITQAYAGGDGEVLNAPTAATAGKISLYHTGSLIEIFNNSGETVACDYSFEWR